MTNNITNIISVEGISNTNIRKFLSRYTKKM